MDILRILIFALVGAGFFAALLMGAGLVRERGRTQNLQPYECGMDPVGTPWVSPNIRFYIFAFIFVVFDVESLFILPWAIQFRALGWEGFTAVLIFVGVLLLGLAYAWRQGALRWE